MKRSAQLGAVLMAMTFSLLFTACASAPTSSPTGPADSQSPSAIAPESSTTNTPTVAAKTNKDDVLDNGGHAEYTWDDYVSGKQMLSGLTSWPEVERIRFISQEESPQVQAQCLTEAGFPATVENDGTSYTVHTAEGQEEAFALASYICDLEYPTDLRYAQALTRTQIRVVYAYYRDQLVPCLQARGLEVSPLPSEETFVEGTASGTNPWSPHDDLPLSSLDTDAMNKDCPPMPSSELLYGS